MNVGEAIGDLLAALSYGERAALRRAEENVARAPSGRARKQQRHVAALERDNAALLEARARELGSPEREAAFAPFFDAFFEDTEPRDWLEAQAWHYMGDALVRDFADVLLPALDPVSAEIVRRTLLERDEQETYALDELTRLLEDDPSERDRVAAYARRIVGEALTQTRRAVVATGTLRGLLGGEEGEKRALLDLLERHRERLDRLGIELVD
ncbi:MAG TPA: ferritin-like fold-containing protein [Actinomycetota bacterium]|nr:ferritin-like fold-containing protein [Actinomycetota bacterium]